MSRAPTLSTEPVYDKVKQVATPSVDPDSLEKVYYIDEIAQHITSNGYRSPCLQFPDELVRDSAQVATFLQRKTGITCFVLADTSYSPCCVDEIAAQHVHGDVVYHFGNACLNTTKALPVVYVSRKELHVDINAIKSHLPIDTPGSNNEKVILYPDTKYIDLALQLASDNVCVAVPSSSYTFIPDFGRQDYTETTPVIPNRVLSQPLPDDKSELKFIYLSDSPSESLALQWSTVFGEILVINGHGERLNINPALRKRYRYVQQIKASGTVGILVNTLSLKDTSSLLERTKAAVTKADKKFYMFVVGKPNVAKLGNFEAVDVWVILGCPQGGLILNNDEYFKPIVTPYELELAFNDEWTGKWLTQFDQVLLDYTTDSDGKEPAHVAAHDEEPLFDLVTGKFVFGNTPLRHVEHLDLDSGSELQKSSNALAIRNTVSTAAQHLQTRTWQGLGSDHADITEEYAELKKGRSGVARNYNEQI